MNVEHIQKLIDRNSELVVKRLFPDLCMIFPELPDNYDIVGPGIPSGVAEARIYRGSVDIPCRVDQSRAFRPAGLPAQNTEVDEYNLHLPVDCDVQPTDKIHLANPLTGVTTIHVIRKMKDKGRWDVTREVTITELGVNDEGA